MTEREHQVEFAKAFRKARLKRDLTLEDVARANGITKQNVSSYENAKSGSWKLFCYGLDELHMLNEMTYDLRCIDTRDIKPLDEGVEGCRHTILY